MITAVAQINEKRQQAGGNEQVCIAEKGSLLYKSRNSKGYQTYYSYKHKNVYKVYFAPGFTVMGVTHTAENKFLAKSQQQNKKIIHTNYQFQEQPFLEKNTIFQCPVLA